MNKLIAIIISAFLTLPVYVWAVDDASITGENPRTVNTIDEDIDTLTEKDSSQYKQPLSRRKIAKKFIFAMGGVAVSSFAIFFLLTIYNRIREGFEGQIRTPDGEASLETPDDINSAVRTFLDKTRW